MVRTVVGYSIIAVIGVVALKLLFGLLGFALWLLWSLLWFAALGFLFYLVLRVISPETARRVRNTIRGESKSDRAA